MISQRKTFMYLSIIGGFVLFCSFYYPLAKADSVAAEQNKISDSGTTISVITSPPAVIRKADKLYQPIQVEVLHFGKELEAEISITGAEPVKFKLQPGRSTAELFVPPIEKNQLKAMVTLKVAGKCLSSRELLLKRVRNWNVYILHHSHVDIGYTHLQTEVERNQWKFLEQAIELARKTDDYPAGSRFKWNVEVLWAVDSYLKQASEPKRKEFIDAVRKGWIGLDALYGNELTALCRPEELVRLVDYAQRLRQRYNLKIDTAMITDVPGYTWGIVPVLAQSGVKYFSIGPNHAHRIGYTLSAWGDKPFYWNSPSGKHNILCWVAGEGYALFHRENIPGTRLFESLKRLEDSKYPYDMVQLRYTIAGDNGPPDPELSEFVRNWNTVYAYPKLIIATTSEMFGDFERQYGNRLPEVHGDFTPYWEDGAASSAMETGLNRAAAERLVQGECLWAMLNPTSYPADRFYTAWRNALLYDEHTWGARCSISNPDSDRTKGQWKIKQAFAIQADAQSRELLNDSLTGYKGSEKNISAVDVFNTQSWMRTDIIILPKEMTVAGDMVKEINGEVVPSQRLSTGELAFMAEDILPFATKRFTFQASQSDVYGNTKVNGNSLRNSLIELLVDQKTGAITSLICKSLNTDLVDRKSGLGLNDYFYVPGNNPDDAKRNGPVKISVKEQGPLIASLLIESEAPGCHKLTRELRVIDGLDRVDIINVIDKQKIYDPEGVHLAFPFNVPDGVMRMDIPWAVARPEVDQLTGTNRNFFTVQRWVDVSNEDFGVTWATLDAPLVEVGSINAPTRAIDPDWMRHIEPSQTLYSYVMNNYWYTNYKAGQEGPTVFRYSIKPHKKFDSAEASRFGIERSQPLVVVPVDKKTPVLDSVLAVKPSGIIATAFKPSNDGKARILRLFNAGGQPEKARIVWTKQVPERIWLSNLAEEQVSKITGPIDMATYEIVTLRIPLSGK